MGLFTQKTRSQKKKKNASKSWGQNLNSDNVNKTRKPRSAAKTETRIRPDISRFTFPSVATVGIIAATVVFSFTALYWDELGISTPNLYDFTITNTPNADRHTIDYALTGIPGIFNLNGNTEAAVPEEILAESAANDNPHGMLQTFEWQQYRVQRGDTVSGIAQQFEVSIGAIIASNDIRNARRLQEGALLRIPNIDGIPYQIKRGDNLSKISVSFNVPLEVILDVNDIKSDHIRAGETIFIPGARMNDIDLRLSLGELFMYPLQRRFITSPFGWRKDPISGATQFHPGVDFRGSIGTTVMASLDGVVIDVGVNWLYGKYIIISHANGYQTLYGHLNSFNVKKGDRVARGRKIGEVGNTGYSTGPHLHFGIFDRNKRWVNPIELLN